MSTKRENIVTDSDTKKLMDVEESKDSGFISGEIETLPEEEPVQQEREQSPIQSTIRDILSKSPMRSQDSGIALVSSQLSDLSLGCDPKLNNLSGTSSSWVPSLKEDSPKDVSKLSEYSWEYFFHQDDNGDTPLHICIYENFTEAIHSLVRLAPNSDLLDVRNDTCQSPLHLAVLTGQPFIVRLLVIAGAKQSVRDRYGETALHLACHKGDLLCVRALTAPVTSTDVEQLRLKYPVSHEKINLEQWNYEGETCIHVAAMQGHTEILKHLVWLKADINAREGKAGYTALHFAVARKDQDMLKYLLNECKDLIQMETQCYGRLTAYEITKDPDVRKLLVSKGAIPIETDSEDISSSDEEDSDNDNKMSYSTSYSKSTGVPINASA